MSTLQLLLHLNTRAKSVGAADVDATRSVREIAFRWTDECIATEAGERNRVYRSLSKIAVYSRSPEPDETIAARWAWLHTRLLDAVCSEIEARDARRAAAAAMTSFDALLAEQKDGVAT